MKSTSHRSTIWQKGAGQIGRLAKRWRLRRANQETRVAVFISGCQRSGTKMLLRTLDQSPQVWTHDHRRRDLAYRGGPDPAYQISAAGSMARLAPIETLSELTHCRQAPVVAFHSLADSQWMDRILRSLPEARAIWIYRRYADVANSAVQLWGDHQLDLVRRFRRREFDRLHWRGENISPEALEHLDACYRDDLTPQEGAALMWYLRNQLLFQTSLHDSERVLLVQYEDLVIDPQTYAPRVFQFLDLPFEPRYVAHIFSRSTGKSHEESFSPGVRNLCDDLLSRLDSVYRAARRSGPSPS